MLSSVHDTLLRMALACMAVDPASALSAPQRDWVRALPQRTTALTPGERERLRGPLITWITERMPRCVEIVAQQFHEKESIP